MNNIYVPTQSAHDWQRLLADPKHWKDGRSAAELAHAWEGASGFPTRVKKALTEGSTPEELTPLVALPEWQTPLRGGRRPSQTDLLVLAGSRGGLVVIGVEGKVDEPFGPTVGEWLGRAPSAGKIARLAFLREVLGLKEHPDDRDLHYQLHHRTAAALIEAARFGARHAVMLVHSFAPVGSDCFEAYRTFASRLGVGVERGVVVAAGKPRSGVQLHLGWVSDKVRARPTAK